MTVLGKEGFIPTSFFLPMSLENKLRCSCFWNRKRNMTFFEVGRSFFFLFASDFPLLSRLERLPIIYWDIPNAGLFTTCLFYVQLQNSTHVRVLFCLLYIKLCPLPGEVTIFETHCTNVLRLLPQGKIEQYPSQNKIIAADSLSLYDGLYFMIILSYFTFFLSRYLNNLYSYIDSWIIGCAYYIKQFCETDSSSLTLND